MSCWAGLSSTTSHNLHGGTELVNLLLKGQGGLEEIQVCFSRRSASVSWGHQASLTLKQREIMSRQLWQGSINFAGGHVNSMFFGSVHTFGSEGRVKRSFCKSRARWHEDTPVEYTWLWWKYTAHLFVLVFCTMCGGFQLPVLCIVECIFLCLIFAILKFVEPLIAFLQLCRSVSIILECLKIILLALTNHCLILKKDKRSTSWWHPQPHGLGANLWLRWCKGN